MILRMIFNLVFYIVGVACLITHSILEYLSECNCEDIQFPSLLVAGGISLFLAVIFSIFQFLDFLYKD